MAAANNLVLNLEKMNEIKFITKNSSHFTLHIGYEHECLGETVLQIDNNKNWKNHIEGKITELSGSCYAVSNSDVRHPRCVLYNSKELSVVIHRVKLN